MLRLIQPISKRNQVVQAMKEAILAGSILPGSSLVESKLAQELGAGIPLVREALIELEHQGFVQRIPYKGTTVTKFDEALAAHFKEGSQSGKGLPTVNTLRSIELQARSIIRALKNV